jgi:hypothetical protein
MMSTLGSYFVDYVPVEVEEEDALWDPEWDDEGNDGNFKDIIKEELAKSQK